MKKILLFLCFLTACLQVRAEVPVACGFTAHKNSVNQTAFTIDTYNAITWPSVTPDSDAYFSTADGKWRPPAGVKLISAHVWVLNPTSVGSVFPPLHVIKLIVNGQQLPFESTRTGICTASIYPNTAVCEIPMARITTQPGDVIELKYFSTNANAVLEGNAAHTWWAGACLP